MLVRDYGVEKLKFRAISVSRFLSDSTNSLDLHFNRIYYSCVR